ncbi:MAG: hypothetical protein JWL76_1621 [Thermoleophilia bacterium]|nr:hypothetical protein [Thermoleophilia bacterium]
MTARRRLTRPLRVVRARAKWLRGLAHHRREVGAGRELPAHADRTPVFILGSPRSGTTLLYQLLVEAFDVGYLANVHAAQPTDVARVEREQRPRTARSGSDFESTHGATKQPWGPSEAGEFWYRFFDRDRHQVDHAAPEDRTIVQLRAAVRAFMDACGASVVFKNTINSLRVPALAAALPEARFVLIERDLTDNARSLLVGRGKRGDLCTWWGARPTGVEQVEHRAPAEQVVWQAREVHDVARRALGELPPERTLHVTYDELCAAPRDLVDRVATWLAATGTPIERRPGAQVPEEFARRGGGELDAELEAALDRAVSEDAR